VGGAFLRSDLLFEVGEILNLQIDLPPNRRISAVGRVVRVSRGTAQDRVPGMGIEFVDLSPAWPHEAASFLDAHTITIRPA
jgi:Tfp pilus assembly protein PilZ